MAGQEINPDKYTVHEILRSVQYLTMSAEEAEEFLMAKLRGEYQKGYDQGRQDYSP